MAWPHVWRQAIREKWGAVAVTAVHPAGRRAAGRIASRAMTAAARGGAVVADFLVPPVCIACRRQLVSHHSLCPACWIDIDFIRAPICDRLGIPLPFDTGGPAVSAAALAAPPGYDRSRSAALHTDVMRGLIHGLKYGDRTDGVAMFGRWLASASSDLIGETDLIVPVPLNRWRLWQRRFNQSAMLARALAAETGVALDTMALVRVRRTRSQVGLTVNQRKTNVSGAFRVPERKRAYVRGKSILLVDDVMTTGATVEASTRALRRAGATTVNVVTLARVVGPVQSTA